jgi:general secretion pathway protein I
MRRARGFSLLEVLVAFAIVTLVGSVLFQIFGGALRNAGAADEYSRAALIAESKLAALGVEKPLQEGSDAGSEEDGRFNWTLTVAPYVAPDTPAPDAGTPLSRRKLVQADMTVSWEAGEHPRSVTLTTLRLMARDAKP